MDESCLTVDINRQGKFLNEYNKRVKGIKIITYIAYSFF